MTEPVPNAILQLLDPLRTKLDPVSVDEVDDWLDHREWELALNLLTDAIYVADIHLAPEAQHIIVNLISEMEIPPERYAFLHLSIAS